MEVFSIAKGFYRLSKNAPSELSLKELDRLRAIMICREAKDVKLVCDTFGMNRATLYRWLKRFDPKDLTSLRGGVEAASEGWEALMDETRTNPDSLSLGGEPDTSY